MLPSRSVSPRRFTVPMGLTLTLALAWPAWGPGPSPALADGDAAAQEDKAWALVDKERQAQDELSLRRALTGREAALGKDHPDIAPALVELARALIDRGKLAEAEPLLRRALSIHEAASGRDHPVVAVDLSYLALLFQQQGNLQEAESLLRRALVIFEASAGNDNPVVATTLDRLAAVLKQRGKDEEAAQLARRALAITDAGQRPSAASGPAVISRTEVLIRAAAIVSGVFLFGFLLSLYFYIIRSRKSRWRRTTGTLYDIELSTEDLAGEGDSPQWGISVEQWYRYTVDGKVYEKKLGIAGLGARPVATQADKPTQGDLAKQQDLFWRTSPRGSESPIYYDPKNPTTAELRMPALNAGAAWQSFYFHMKITLVVTLGFFVMTLFAVVVSLVSR